MLWFPAPFPLRKHRPAKNSMGHSAGRVHNTPRYERADNAAATSAQLRWGTMQLNRGAHAWSESAQDLQSKSRIAVSEAPSECAQAPEDRGDDAVVLAGLWVYCAISVVVRNVAPRFVLLAEPGAVTRHMSAKMPVWYYTGESDAV